ncbi:hypothetical protein N8482_00435 [Chitinophagales bacterium]|nr:hypothetical protein [Chitinophagales bacterium]
MRIAFFIGLIVSQFFAAQLWAQDDVFDLDHSLEFADYLWENNRPLEASREYERCLFLDKDNEGIKWKLARSLMAAKLRPQANKRILHWFPLQQMPNRFGIVYARNQYALQNFQALSFEFDELKLLDIDQRTVGKTALYLRQYEWESANSQIQLIPESATKQASTNLLQSGRSIVRKSPALATLFSIVIPGTGKMYANRWIDGIFSLLIVSSTAYGSYSGFRDSGIKSFRGWFFGAFALGFYLGNIWGSHKAARLFNEQKNHDYAEAVDRFFMEHFVLPSPL